MNQIDENDGPGHALVRSSQAALPTPADKQQLKAYLKVLTDPETLELQQQLAAAYDQACVALIGPNDVQKEGNRTFKKKSAWRKLARHFGISTEILEERREMLAGDVFLASCRVRAISPWGQSAEATGACGTDEESGRRHITIADAIGTAQTRATNRAVSDLIAMGEVSAEELQKDGGGRAADREMTLEEANAQPWPWKQPADLAGKQLADVPTKMILTAEAWGADKIEKGGAGRAVHLLVEACALILSHRADVEAVQAELEAERKAKAERKAAKEAAPEASDAQDPDDGDGDDEAREEPTPTSGDASSSTPGDSAPPSSSDTAPTTPDSTPGASEARESSQGAPIEALIEQLRGIINESGFPASDVKKFEAILLRRDLTEQQLRRAIAEAQLIVELEG